MVDLSDVVVVAGPNGCGKSTVFDAIRLLKSAYGGYQPNEWQHWFSEFQINPNQRPEDLLVLLQDKAKPLEVTAAFRIATEEREWLRQNARMLIQKATWREVAPQPTARNLNSIPLAVQMRTYAPEVEQRTAAALPVILRELDAEQLYGQVVMNPDGKMTTSESLLLELIFSQYAPQHLGVIDYHGAQRNYAREQVGGINLSIESAEQQLSQHALYNYANKYTNIKTELASGYVRDLIAREAGQAPPRSDLNDTLKELFATFFSGKEFLGPRPAADGALSFNVQTLAGGQHDINDLSSGEKEVLYGYLRLRNTAPRNSVLLIDEPELHLNPRLIQGLPDFYHRHLGKALSNQLWLVTHSDTLLRHAVGRADFRVYHMQPPGAVEGGNQLREVRANEEVERAVIDLVGDLAAYRPGGKVVLLEGGGDSEFDVRMVSTLFPDFASRVNTVSAGNKQRVKDLHALLATAQRSGALGGRFFSIVDRDFDDSESEYPGDVMAWDRYHIENYLLEPGFVLQVVKELHLAHGDLATEDGIDKALEHAAESTLPALVRYRMEQHANRTLVDQIRTRIDPQARSAASALRQAVQSSKERLDNAADALTQSTLDQLEQTEHKKFRESLVSGAWRSQFRGRDILTQFATHALGGHIKYAVLRDLVLARMQDAAFQPSGMKIVLDRILSASAHP